MKRITLAVSLNLFLAGVGTIQGVPTEEEKNYPEYVEQVFLTEAGALKSVFPVTTTVKKEIHTFTPAEKERIESKLGWILNEKAVTVYKGIGSDGKAQGFAVIAEEIGKFKPITFIVKAGMDGKVERVEVMVYREAVGSEVRRQRFARQFRGKSAKDPLRINRDIINVTGATMSVQAMTAGVKKALIILDELYFKK